MRHPTSNFMDARVMTVVLRTHTNPAIRQVLVDLGLEDPGVFQTMNILEYFRNELAPADQHNFNDLYQIPFLTKQLSDDESSSEDTQSSSSDVSYY